MLGVSFSVMVMAFWTPAGVWLLENVSGLPSDLAERGNDPCRLHAPSHTSTTDRLALAEKRCDAHVTNM